MTPKKSQEPARRLARLLAGSVVAALCIGGGAAVAQTPLPSDPAAPAVDDTTTPPPAPEPAAEPPDDGSIQNPAGAEEESDAAAREGRVELTKEVASPAKVFFSGVKRARFEYKISGGTADLEIQAVHRNSGDVKRSWARANVEPGTEQVIRWDGATKGGDGVPKGKYFFRVKTQGGSELPRKQAVGGRNIQVYPAKFPVRGPHQYWDGWGAGRGHEGQDIGAACGTRMQVARAGTVAWKSYDGGGWGYYVVINVKGQDRAHLYSHLKGRADIRDGERVETGQKLGLVGQSGNAVGCHLHFEFWKGSWGNGGPVPSVTKHMREWDSWS